MRSFIPLLAGLLVALAVTPGRAVELRPGLEAGGSLVWLDYAEESEAWQTGSRPDFHMAATVQFEFGPQGSLLAGLRYSGLGNEVDYDQSRVPGGGEQAGSFSLHQRYIGLPLGARWDLYRSGGPFLYAGIEVAWLLGAELQVSERATPASPAEDWEEDVADALESVSVAGFVGAGLALVVASNEVELTVRYAHGFTDPAQAGSWPSGWSNQEFAFGVGLRL